MEKYKTIKELGKGSFGAAYLVEHKETHIQFCLKSVKPENGGQMKLILNEAESMKKVDHPNVIKLIDTFFDKQGFHFITEYMEKGDLLSVLRNRQTPFSESEAIDFLQQIVFGLDAIHTSGWIHRDLKPQNILLNSKGTWKIADFGLAKSLASSVSTGLVGTAHYVSPEVLGDKEHTPAIDIWSIGCILYEIITKKKSFDGETRAALYNSIINCEPVPLPQEINVELNKIIFGMLNKNPSERITLKQIQASSLFNNKYRLRYEEARKHFLDQSSPERGSIMFRFAVDMEEGFFGSPDKQEAMIWYEKAAGAGHVKGMLNYGVALAEGYNGKFDKVAAMFWFQKAAEAGDVKAMLNYGIALSNGDNGKFDKAAAMFWFQKAAEAGDTSAMYNYGIALSNGDNGRVSKVAAMLWYKKAAEGGDTSAMYNYGVALENGYNGKFDKAAAMVWYKKAAEAGNVSGMYNYGVGLEKGNNGKVDKAAAMIWYKKAAEAGDVSGMYNYGVALEVYTLG